LALLVAIEGIDGSGKGTQSRQLHKRIEESGARGALISFPRYDDTLFGKAVGDFLNGRFGTLEEVSPFLVSLLYAGDRFESRDLLLDALDRNDVVVLDRYVASNLAHQAAKLSGAEREELIGWICRIEHEIFLLPSPDLVLLLDLPVSEAQQLIATKQSRTYTDQPADLQEADARYLARVREVYLKLAVGGPNWHKLACLNEGTLRAIDEISEEIWNIVEARRNA